MNFCIKKDGSHLNFKNDCLQYQKFFFQDDCHFLMNSTQNNFSIFANFKNEF